MIGSVQRLARNPGPGAMRGALDASPADRGLKALLTDGLWVLFIVIASYAATPFKDYDVERYAWLAADISVMAVFLLRPGPFLALMQKHPIIVSWPVLACISAFWSVAPAISLYHGLQLFMTILVGFYLCLYASLERILQLLFVALLVSGGLSFLYVFANPGAAVGYFGEWIGVFPHKNVLGHMMALLAFTGVCLFLQGWRPLLTGFAILFALAMLVMSQSGVAAVAIVLAPAPIPLALAYRRGPATFCLALAVALIVCAALVLALEVSNVDVFESSLNALGKDSTLTGRTILWDFGIEAYESRPWLGFGYKAWWESPDTAAGLLRFVIGQDLWFFHNNFVDVAVAFGTIGPVLLALGLDGGLVSRLRTFAADAQFINLWPVLYIVFVLVLTFVENPLFQNHSIHQMLLAVAIAGLAGSRRVGGPAVSGRLDRAR